MSESQTVFENLTSDSNNHTTVFENLTSDSNNHTESSEFSNLKSDVESDPVGYGYVSIMGRRRIMEDAVMVSAVVGEYSLFAVYDGHGSDIVAKKCKEKMYHCIEKHLEKVKEHPETNFEWEKMMVECFLSLDEELKKDNSEHEVINKTKKIVGSTAVVVLIGKNELVVANSGDSRVVLFQDGTAVPLSKDDKPQREHEKESIETATGTLISHNGWRVEGVLAISKSLEDVSIKPYVISEPEVTVIERSKSDRFLIIASDGLFDVVPNEVACETATECLLESRGETGASKAATILAQMAIARGSKDNISIIVVQIA